MADHLKTGQIVSHFEWFTSLDRLMKKRVIKNILFMPKRSRLVDLKSGQKTSGLSPFENWIVRISDVDCMAGL
jgi:hypothetical protein